MDLTKSRYYKVIRAKQIVKKTAYPPSQQYAQRYT